MSGSTSRKPSGSSVPSRAHTPTSVNRILNQGAGNIYGSHVGSGNSFKNLNTGWQVWGSPTIPAQNNASATNVHEGSLPNDLNYLGNPGDGWTASRRTSGNWDDGIDGSQQADFSQLDRSQLVLQSGRIRQGGGTQNLPISVTRNDDRSTGSRNGQLSPQPQTFESYGVNDHQVPRFGPSTSPSRPFNTAVYHNQLNGLQSVASTGNYDLSSNVNEEISLAFRGMAVEDERGAVLRQGSQGSQTQVSTVLPFLGPYHPVPQMDYGGYYPVAGRDPYMEYTYGYDVYRGPDHSHYASPVMVNSLSPNLYPPVPALASVPIDIRHHPPHFAYDFSPPRSVPTHYYYPASQPMLFSPPTHAPIISGINNSMSLGERKHEMQYNTQHSFSPPNHLYRIRSNPSPHPHLYNRNDYGPVNIPTGGNLHMYGQGGLSFYPQSMRPMHHNFNEARSQLRSIVLEEFRVDKTRKWELQDIIGYVIEFSADQHGSRFIQQKLETASAEERRMIFDEIVPVGVLSLVQNVFGNYVIQKLLELGTPVQRSVLINLIEGHIFPLSTQIYGCRVIQKAIECMSPEEHSNLVRELEPHIIICVKDSNGNHVVQKLIEHVSPDRLGFIYVFHVNVQQLAMHPFGCRVLQRCLEHLPNELTQPLLDEFHRLADILMQDQFGNYVIQFILEHGKPQDKAFMIGRLRCQISQMARHKFASNVCEKALVCAEAESRRALIGELLFVNDGYNQISAMMKDQYANYVLQRALSVADDDQREALANSMKPQLAVLRRYSGTFSKHLSSIERLLSKIAS